MDQNIQKRFKSLSFLVGNTPLLDIQFKFKDSIRHIYAKAENLNMTGSIKDRMALHILKKAYESGELKPGDTIIEATSGNTGISFASLGRALGHKVIIYMPDWMSRERVDLIQSLGATIRPVTRDEGGFIGSIKMSEELAAQSENSFLPRQFSNYDNIEAHYETTGPELWWQLQFQDITPQAFVAGVGTGGTIMGVGKFLKEQDDSIKINPMEPAESPTLRTGKKVGSHRIQGISDEFIPSIVNLDELDTVIDVNDGDAIIMAQKLSAELGLAMGISSGANFIAALKVQEKIGPEAVVVTIFPDDNKKYLSTDLLRKEPVYPGYMAPEIELISFNSLKRTCHTCCDYHYCTHKIVPFETVAE